MNRMRVRLWLLVMLVLLVGPGLVHAQPATEEHTAVRVVEPSAVGKVWDWLVSMFGKAGSFIDPNGIPIPSGTSNTHTDAGSFIDPNGGQ